MSHSSQRWDLGSFTSVGIPLYNNYFGTSKTHHALGLPTVSDVALFDGTPEPTTTNALAVSQTLASTVNAVFLATKPVTGVVVATAGTGYAVGDILSSSNGTKKSSAATFLVTQVDGAGGVVGVSILNPGIFSAGPTTVTGGNGSSAVLTMTVTQTVDILGNTIYVLDYARQITFGFASAPTTTLTVKGYDILGRKISETISVTATDTTAHTVKTYSSIFSVTSSSVTSLTTFVVGYNTVFGLPVCIRSASSVLPLVASSGVNAIDGGTTTVGVTTNPATATSGDPLGTYTPSYTPDAAKELLITFKMPYNYYNCSGNEATINPIWISGVQPFTAW